MASEAADFKLNVEGFKPYTGGEELRRAIAALAGPTIAQEQEESRVPSGSAGEPGSAPQPQMIPISVKSADHSTRELAFAAQRYAKAAQRNSADFEAIYNHGLALQELASRVTSSRDEQMRLLQQACERYEAAWKLRQSSHSALYNWGVALSDMSRAVKTADRSRAHDFLAAAADKYATSLRWNPNNPQALNNWGLVLQELSTMRAEAERDRLVRQSVAKFRAAIRLRPEFDRACYNLGTVYYSHAFALQTAAQAVLSSQLTKDPEREAAERSEEAAVAQTFRLAAQYIALSFALQPGRDVYARSLKVVRPLLPGGHLRGGFLTAVRPDTDRTCAERWERSYFVIDHDGFRTAEVPEEDATEDSPKPAPFQQRIELADITDVKPCLDPSLPDGHAFWVALLNQPQGHIFLSDNGEDAEGWVDALLMCAHIAAGQRVPALAYALTAEFS
ncbi:g7652 [Coccomyxa elongata]